MSLARFFKKIAQRPAGMTDDQFAVYVAKEFLKSLDQKFLRVSTKFPGTSGDEIAERAGVGVRRIRAAWCLVKRATVGTKNRETAKEQLRRVELGGVCITTAQKALYPSSRESPSFKPSAEAPASPVTDGELAALSRAQQNMIVSTLATAASSLSGVIAALKNFSPAENRALDELLAGAVADVAQLSFRVAKFRSRGI